MEFEIQNEMRKLRFSSQNKVENRKRVEKQLKPNLAYIFAKKDPVWPLRTISETIYGAPSLNS